MLADVLCLINHCVVNININMDSNLVSQNADTGYLVIICRSVISYRERSGLVS